MQLGHKVGVLISRAALVIFGLWWLGSGVASAGPSVPSAEHPHAASAGLKAFENDGDAFSNRYTTPACADLNGDGMVTLVDLLIQITYFGLSVPPAPAQADLNGDTLIGLFDVMTLIKHYNTATPCQDNPIGPGGTPKPTPTPADPPPPEPEMSLNVTSAGADCDDPQKPAKCTVPPDSQFTLAVEVNHTPVKGYIAFQSQIVYGTLKYKPTDDGRMSEIVWPGGTAPYGFVEVRIGPVTGQEGVVHHLAASTSQLPPYPVSTYEDSIVEIALNCPPGGSFQVALPVLSVANPSATHFVKDGMINALPKTAGQELVDVDGDTTPELVDVAGTLSINCAESAVGGIAELGEVAAAPLQTGDSSGLGASVVAGITAGAAALTVALTAGGWYMRRRVTR